MRSGHVIAILILVMFFHDSALAGSDSFITTDVIGRGLFGLAVCLGTFSILVYYLKSRCGGTNAQQHPIRVLGRCNLSSKTTLVLAEVRGREYLLAVGGDSISLIDGKLGEQYDATNDAKLYSLAGGGE